MGLCKLTLEFQGTAYHGWQVQLDPPTIQGTPRDVPARFAGTPVRAAAAGLRLRFLPAVACWGGHLVDPGASSWRIETGGRFV